MSVFAIPFFYSKMPIIIQNIAVSLGGLRLHHTRKGKMFYKTKADIDRIVALKEDEISAWQLDKVKKIVAYAYHHVPFYRKRFDGIGFRPDDLRSWEDYRQLPFTTKNDLTEHETEIVSTRVKKSMCFPVYTTGTTGKPRPILTTRDAVVAHYAHFSKIIEMRGIDTDSRWVRFGGTKIVPEHQKKSPFWRYNYFEKQMYMSIRHISRKTVKDYIDALNRFRPVYINGFPSVLSVLAGWLCENNLRGPSSLRLIICDSESILPDQRKLIESAFSCKVLDYYGMAEKVVFMAQCEKGNYHVYPTYGAAEFISEDMKPVISGLGMIVGTTLVNNATPLIRYMTEDIARVTPSCECGMGGQPVSDIEGRMGDFVYTPSGKIISPTLMEFCMRNVRNAKKVMVEQDDIKMLTVHFYPDREFSQDEADDFVHVARELTDNEIEIRTVVHPEPPPKTIKYRFVLSRIARQSHWNKALGSNNPTH